MQRPPANANRTPIELIHAWRPAGSPSLLWVQDMSAGRPLKLMRWGGVLYLPVTPGLRLGIGVFNGSSQWQAYPTYIEGANLYDSGPAQPNDCTPDHMWEVPPHRHMIMDALMNPWSSTRRPLVIVNHGEGFGIGIGIEESTFGTHRFRGMIHLYERSSNRPETSHPPNPFGLFLDGGSAEVCRGHISTGVEYLPNAELVAGLRVESRKDLAEVLRAASKTPPDWVWAPSGPFWFTNGVPPAPPTAPQVPVAPVGPHKHTAATSATAPNPTPP